VVHNKCSSTLPAVTDEEIHDIKSKKQFIPEI